MAHGNYRDGKAKIVCSDREGISQVNNIWGQIEMNIQ